MFVKRLKKSSIDFLQKATVGLVKPPFDICLNWLIMCKEGWCVGLGQVGIA